MEITDRIRLLFRREKKPYLQLKGILGFYPRNIKLYQLALRHKSVAHYQREEARERGEKVEPGTYVNNERLEFLGDAVLGAVVADILYKHYGCKQEGFLTKIRSNIVCRKSLNKLAVQIGLDKLIQYSGSVTTAHNSFMNGNAFEAFFGAIYLDRGYAYCYKFMEDRIFKNYINVDKVAHQDENFKSSLIEWCQKYGYQFRFSQREIREDKSPKFISEVYVEGVQVGIGEGYSKKEADQNSAHKALNKVRRDKALVEQIKRVKEEAKEKAQQQSLLDKAINSLQGRDTIVFDLDGTLLNTLQDLFESTNYALEECGYPTRTLEEVRMFVGNGVRKLIERATPEGTSETAIDECLEVFKSYYVMHCQDNTAPYSGIKEMLTALKAKGYKIAIVSNKLQAGVTELHERFFRENVDVAIGESEDIQRKPAPDMVVKALELLEVTKDRAIYVGDSDVDILTAQNSELPCISVLWGFRDKEFLKEHGAKIMVGSPLEIPILLNKKQ